jgi:hypothetical protein
MQFRWSAFGWWLLTSLSLVLVGLALLGIPGLIFYEGWRITLNTVFQREIVADLGRIGPGAWVIAIYMSIIVPIGLPLNYAVTAYALSAQMRRLSFQKTLMWVLLLTLLWSIVPTLLFSMQVFNAKKN